MRRFLPLAVFAFILLLSPKEAFSNIFEAYGKRHMGIRKHFVEALSSDSKKWQQDGCAYPDKERKIFLFHPEHEFKANGRARPNWNERFSYQEFNLNDATPERKLNDLNAFYARFFREKNKSPYCTENFLFESDSEIRSEAFTTSGVLSAKTKHRLAKILKTGDYKYVVYQYEISERNLSPEERDYWFKLFEYAKVGF